MQYVGAGDNPVIDKTLGILMDEWEPPTLTTTDISCCPVRANYWATMAENDGLAGDGWRVDKSGMESRDGTPFFRVP